MASNLKISNSIKISVPVSKAWQALTDPELIKGYLFGTTVDTDWKKGSSITYTGEWQGKSYKDLGKIIEIEPEKSLHTTYLSGMSGKEDKPENYVNVYWTVEADANGSKVTISQDGIASEKDAEGMKKNWDIVLDGMKKLLE